MLKVHTKEQLWEIYQKLPSQMKDYLASDKVSDIISDIYQNNKISDEEGSVISDVINQVLFKIISVDDFQQVLENETDLKNETIKKIGQEINRYVFFLVKDVLGEKTEAKTKETLIGKKSDIKKPGLKKKVIAEEINKPPKKIDTYREPIE